MSGPTPAPTHESHYVLPGHDRRVCPQSVTTGWGPAPAGPTVEVTCPLHCRSQRRWLNGDSDRYRTDPPPITIEPWPAGFSKLTAGDDDPARGEYARPGHLQLCLKCGELRGTYGTFDNLCACDREQWDSEPLPRHGDLSNNVDLCKSCIGTITPTTSRWSAYYCPQCHPAIQELRRRTRSNIVPVGPHSLMNGISSSASDTNPITDSEAAAFARRLTRLFADQESLSARTRRRTLARARQIGFTGHAARVSDYVGAGRLTGHTPHTGFVDLVDDLGLDIDTHTLDELWRRVVPQTAPVRTPPTPTTDHRTPHQGAPNPMHEDLSHNERSRPNGWSATSRINGRPTGPSGQNASEVGPIWMAGGAPRCPVCTSWEVTRHVEGFRVWFTCNRCGSVFG